MDISLETTHCTSGGSIDLCALYFNEYEGGVISDNTLIDSVGLPFIGIPNALDWI